MKRRKLWTAVALMAAIAGVALGAQWSSGNSDVATAAPSPNAVTDASQIFGCRASVARVDIETLTIEPAVANTGTVPCKDDQTLLQKVAVPSSAEDLVTVGPAGAFTYETGSLGDAPGATAVTAVDAVSIPSIGLTIVGPIQAQASYECEGTTLVENGSSDLSVIDLDGKEIDLASSSSPTAPITIPGLATITFNQEIKTNTSLTERILDVQLLTGIDIVVGEATVTLPVGDPCSGNVTPTTTTATDTITTPATTTTVTTPGGTTTVVTTPGTSTTTTKTITTPGTGTGYAIAVGSTPTNLEACAPGSQLDPATGDCVIFLAGGGTIYVSKPFKGPSGGTVETIPEAESQYGVDPCLTEAGLQDWVLVATARGGRVKGTPYSDRILAMGAYERVAGLAGNDCIWGKGGNQTLFDGNGKDRTYVGTGHNRVGIGNGNNYINARYISGAVGTDWLTDGNGDNTIYGGKNATRIDDGLGHDKVYGGAKGDRIYIASGDAKVWCGNGKDTLFARGSTALFGQKHSCEKIHFLKSK